MNFIHKKSQISNNKPLIIICSWGYSEVTCSSFHFKVSVTGWVRMGCSWFITMLSNGSFIEIFSKVLNFRRWRTFVKEGGERLQLHGWNCKEIIYVASKINMFNLSTEFCNLSLLFKFKSFDRNHNHVFKYWIWYFVSGYSFVRKKKVFHIMHWTGSIEEH